MTHRQFCKYLVITIAFAATISAFDDPCPAYGQEQSEQPPKQYTLTIPLTPQNMFKPDAEGFVVAQGFDVNDDGIVDLELRTKNGRGPLSTYYTVSRLVAVNGTKLLKGGTPQNPGDKIELSDLFQTSDAITLCSVGASLRFPDRSFEEFSSGTWWGQTDKGLALFIPGKDDQKIGFAKLSVTKNGAVTLGESKLKSLKLDIEF
jgi:hypothetical protein